MKTFDEIFTETFRLPPGPVADTLTAKDIPEWDSMNYLLFISAIEKEFGLTFTMEEVMNAQTVGDIRGIVDARRAQS
jgi:acyl carrier protein